MAASVVVIGVGNDLRGDDAAGLEVARRLRDEPDVSVRPHAGEAVDMIELWRDADAVVLVDAVRSGAAPGTVHWIDASHEPVPTGLRRMSSHAIGAADAIELARVLDRLPATVIVFGVEGERFGTGAEISDRVAQAIESAASAVRHQARSLARPCP